jgi:phosphoribosylaminoimidazole-succinocarboxamide synthase
MATKEHNIVLDTKLPLPIFIKGKVRDSYDLGSHLLIIATDRISAFDVVLPTGIPLKGHVLNRLSNFWFRTTKEIIPNHLVETLDDLHGLDYFLTEEQRFNYPSYLRGRSMIVKKVKRLPLECVARGYLAGSAWAEYKQKGTIGGRPMPAGMNESQELPDAIFTPTTKADTGHDEPVTKEYINKVLGARISQELEEKSIVLYKSARKYALGRGIIIADTKFEYGIDNGKLILIDEMLTPDSSRFWDAEKYKVGQSQESFDKQPVRDWLTNSGWNKEPPAPALPPDVVKATTERYVTAYERLTGRKLAILE